MTPDSRRFGAAARTRTAVTLLVAGCLALIGLAVTGQASVPEGIQFIQVGHWVYNDSAQSVLHIDGATSQVDARAYVPGAASGSQVAQGDNSGYVVGRTRITEFDKATLSVENTTTPPAPETPVVLEVAGGPYLVYRNAGQVVRLGDPTAAVPAGGPLSRPVATTEGTVWVHRIDNGSICELTKDAAVLACPAQLPPGHGGALALVGDQPVVLDTTADTLHTVGKDGLGAASAIGIKLSPAAQVANNAVDGRLAVTDPERNRLHLIDTAGLGNDRPAAKPISVELPKDSRFGGPVTMSRVVALVDETRQEVLTYDSNGSLKSTKKVPGTEPPRLSRGEDNRIYVDSSTGSHVLVVNGEDGSVVDVDVDKAASSQTAGAPSSAPEPPPASGPPAAEPPSKPQAKAAAPPPPPVADATPPGAPRNVTATAGDGSAKVSWRAAADNGARITGYRLSWRGGSIRVGGSARSATVRGLANGTSYVITVAAENSAGRGAAVSAKAVVPRKKVTAPSSPSKPSPSKPSSTKPSGPPTVSITGVRSTNTGLAVSVNANGKGASATCQADFMGARSKATPCSGATTVSITNIVWAGAITVTATIKTAGGIGSDSWIGVPQTSSGGGGSGSAPDGSGLVWLGPIALVGKRRGKGKDLL